MVEPYGSGRDGRAGVKVKRVERTFVIQASRALVVGTSRIPARSSGCGSKIEEGSGEAEHRGIDQGSPPVEDSPGVVAPAKGAAAHRAPPQAKMRLRVEPLGAAEKSAVLVRNEQLARGIVRTELRGDPEDPTNHTPVCLFRPRGRSQAARRPEGSARATSFDRTVSASEPSRKPLKGNRPRETGCHP